MSAPGSDDHVSVTRLQPSSGWVAVGFRELWAYRELLFFLTWRDVKVRYRQTVLGASWAIIQPVTTMIVFSLFFGRLAKVPSDGVPYPLFSFAGLVPWTFFANSLINSSGSLVANASMIKKIYFPRLLIPAASSLASLVDFVLSFVVLVGLMVFYGTDLSARLLWLPAFVLLALVTSLGVGFWLTALNIRFRDIRYALPFIVQVWLFISPVAYSATLIEDGLMSFLYGLNPMAGVIEGFRWSLLGAGRGPSVTLAASATVSLLVFISGVYYFRRLERTFADVA